MKEFLGIVNKQYLKNNSTGCVQHISFWEFKMFPKNIMGVSKILIEINLTHFFILTGLI